MISSFYPLESYVFQRMNHPIQGRGMEGERRGRGGEGGREGGKGLVLEIPIKWRVVLLSLYVQWNLSTPLRQAQVSRIKRHP